MKKIHRVTIDRKHGSAYIYFEPPRKGASVRQVNLQDAVIFDLARDGSLLGIEILDPEITERFLGENGLHALEEAHIPFAVT